MSAFCGDTTPHPAHPDVERLNGQYCIGNMGNSESKSARTMPARNIVNPLQVEIDFSSNPGIISAFREWVRSGAIWKSFGEWYANTSTTDRE